MDTGKYVEIPAGHAGVVHLRVIPKTSIALSAAGQKLTALRTMVTLSGRVENLPDGTSVRFFWTVQRGTETETYQVLGVKLKVENNTTGSVTVPLDVIEHKLIGKGTVGFKIEPDFPYCNPQVVAPGALTFDNPLSVTFSDLTDKRIGSVVTICPAIGALFKSAIVKLTLHERDEGEGESATTEDMAHEITWTNGDKSERTWRIGCASADGGVVFDYMESHERGDYEIDYALSVSTDGKTFHVIQQSAQLLSVPRPKLEFFTLEPAESTVWNAGLYNYWSTVISNKMRDEAAQIPVYLLRAKGRLSGYDPGLNLPVQISLWTIDTDCNTAQFKARGATGGIEQTVRIRSDGYFDVELINFCELSSNEDWCKIHELSFFAVLRLPLSITGSEDGVPIHQVFDYDSASISPFLDGQRVSLLKGTAVCTLPPDQTEVAPTFHEKYTPVYEKHQKLLDDVQIVLDAQKKAAVELFKKNWASNQSRYEAVAADVDMPALLIAALHWRESSGKFDRYLHQGDPLGKPAVHVPKNIPVFDKWEDSAAHALKLKQSLATHLSLNRDAKDRAKFATYAEFYNGLGYHNKDRVSPYVYSGTNRYTSGKYVKDGVFDATVVDAQVGVIALVESVESTLTNA